MARHFFNAEQEEEIIAAIKVAEKNTSGEIKVHVEHHCNGNATIRAAEVFEQLNMHKTELHSGVLFYLATDDHEFVVMGDTGINEKVPANFWDNMKENMQSHFKAGLFVEGLCEGIQMAGNILKKHFPYLQEDTNEISDGISKGD